MTQCNKAVADLQREISYSNLKLQKLQRVEQWFQKEREALLNKRCVLTVTKDCGLPGGPVANNTYEQLHNLLSTIQMQELQIMDLNENIQRGRMKKEFKTVLKNGKTGQYDNVCAQCLKKWYSEMKYERKQVNSETLKDPPLSLMKDELFYNTNYMESEGQTTLMFSTRHRGVAVRIVITCDRDSSLKVQASLAVNSLDEAVIKYIEDRNSASNLVTEIIWKSIDMYNDDYTCKLQDGKGNATVSGPS